LQAQGRSEVVKLPNSTNDIDTVPGTQSSVLLSGVSVVSGIIQGACAILVASSSLKILVGVAGLAAAMKSSQLHSEPVRLSLMVISTVLAVVTVFVLWNGYRLRNLPSARWRKRTLSLGTKLAILFSLATALVTVALIIGEVAIHPIFGHHR
jgi:hypothetical protein